jgi:predicted RNA-binding protein with PUA domain
MNELRAHLALRSEASCMIVRSESEICVVRFLIRILVWHRQKRKNIFRSTKKGAKKLHKKLFLHEKIHENFLRSTTKRQQADVIKKYKNYRKA